MRSRNIRPQVARALTLAAAGSYLANATFGALVATGTINNEKIRWVHHALFTATISLTLSALAAGTLTRRPAAKALTVAALPLLALPRAHGRRRHVTIAAAAAPAYLTAIVLEWRRY